MTMKRIGLLTLLALMLAACSGNDPGPLAGTWKSSLGTTIQFREGETVADGMVHKVSYKVSGDTVQVIRTEESAKGSSATYTMIDANNAKTPYLTIKRIQ